MNERKKSSRKEVEEIERDRESYTYYSWYKGINRRTKRK